MSPQDILINSMCYYHLSGFFSTIYYKSVGVLGFFLDQMLVSWRIFSSQFFVCFHHQFNLVRELILTSSGSSLLPIAVVGDQTVILITKFSVNYHWTNWQSVLHNFFFPNNFFKTSCKKLYSLHGMYTYSLLNENYSISFLAIYLNKCSLYIDRVIFSYEFVVYFRYKIYIFVFSN
jgi:hypothetical protein